MGIKIEKDLRRIETGKDLRILRELYNELLSKFNLERLTDKQCLVIGNSLSHVEYAFSEAFGPEVISDRRQYIDNLLFLIGALEDKLYFPKFNFQRRN